MSMLRRTRFIDWIFCIAIFLVGLFFLLVGEFSRRHGTTLESELTVATGKATNVTLSESQGVEYAHFAIEGQTVDYSSNLRGYRQVLKAIRQGEPITIQISTKQETLLPRNGWVPLYALSIGNERLLSYQETISKGDGVSSAPFILAAVLLILGGWGLFSCSRNRNRSSAPLSAQEVALAWNDPKRIRTATILFSLALYVATLIAVLHPDSTPTFIAVFSDMPMGMQLRLFLTLYFSLVLLPLPIASWHLFRIIFWAVSQGGGFSKSQILHAIIYIPSTRKDLKRSRLIVLGVGIFYLSMIAGWIVYADSRGI